MSSEKQQQHQDLNTNAAKKSFQTDASEVEFDESGPTVGRSDTDHSDTQQSKPVTNVTKMR